MKDRHALPLYVQLAELLTREIASGRLTDGERLPPEREMATGMGTSVGTLRKALGLLEDQGLLERRQGSGNYVQARTTANSVYAFFRVELAQGGGLPTADLLDVACLPKPADLPLFGRSETAHRIRRLRRLNGTPAVLEEIWLDASYAPRINALDLSESLYLFYREKLGLWITRVEDAVGLGQVPDWASPTFGMTAGAPALMVERLSYAQDGVRAEVSRNWINTDVARYVARIS